jgi:HK97 family phage major capsid protein
MVTTADRQVNGALRKFAESREGARRFHREKIGRVNPDHCFADWIFKVANRDEAGIRKTYGDSLQREFGERIYTDRRGKVVHLASDLDSSGVRSKAAMSVSGSGAVGGYLVPPEVRDELMRDVSEEAFVRSEATVVPMRSATLDLPLPDATTTTGVAGVPTFFGGIQMSFGAEAMSIPETEPKIRLVELRANELVGYCVVSNPMMQDALGLNAWLRRLFARSVAWFEDYFFMRGNGVGQPTGALNSAAAIKVTRNGANLVKYVDLSTMLTDLLPYSYLHAAWYITVSAMVQVTQLIDASGKTAWVPNYPNELDSDGKGNRSIGAVFGRPTYVTEKLPALGTLGDVMLFDPTLYVIGDRQAVEIDVSPDVNFKSNQATWRIIERVDGQPWFSKSVVLSDQATTVSSIVILN